MTKRIKQIQIYFRKNFRLFMNQKDWKFIVIAAVISVLVCAIVGDNMFKTFEATQSGFFAVISAGVWIGVFNSIQRICKEHNTITTEYRSGLHISSYVLSHVLFDFFICLIQSIVLVAVCYVFIDFPSDGAVMPMMIEFFVTIFLVIWGSDIMGIMISSVASDPNVAMTAMPFVLILQLVMCGVLFELDDWSEAVSNVTFSKWGMSALGCSVDLNNNKEFPIAISKLLDMPLDNPMTKDMYDSEAGVLFSAWGMIVLISSVCTLISIASLKFRNRKS